MGSLLSVLSPSFRLYKDNERHLQIYPNKVSLPTYFEFFFLILIFFSLQESDNLWWDSFVTEFFEDDATMTLQFCLEDGPKRYSESFYFFFFLFPLKIKINLTYDL